MSTSPVNKKGGCEHHSPPVIVTHDDADSSEHVLPPPPNPSDDNNILKISPTGNGDPSPTSSTSTTEIDVFTLSSISALKLLCAGVEALVRVTGDIPPTPPLSQPTTPHMRGMQAEKDSIAKLNLSCSGMAGNFGMTDSSRASLGSSQECDIDGVSLRKQPLGSPDSAPDSVASSDQHHIIGANAEPITVQHNAITRKFYSKRPPPISLEDYLMRIHQYCPMSTAVYLAASYYIHKLAFVELVLPVTRRNSHRLILAALRISMKALEDQSYAHSRFAKVGGVSENELARLEISFCFLMGFELSAKKELLLSHAIKLKELSAMQGSVNGLSGFTLRMPGKMMNETVQEVTADA